MRTGVFANLLFTLCYLASNTKAECLRYDQNDTYLTGTVELRIFFGPPNFGEDPETDSKETQALLKLDQPICVIEDYKKHQEAEINQTEITLAPHGSISLSKYAGKRIRVKGNLYHSDSGHHHTSVLISIAEQPEVIK